MYFAFGEAEALRIDPRRIDVVHSFQQDARQGITNKVDGKMNHVTKCTYFPYVSFCFP